MTSLLCLTSYSSKNLRLWLTSVLVIYSKLPDFPNSRPHLPEDASEHSTNSVPCFEKAAFAMSICDGARIENLLITIGLYEKYHAKNSDDIFALRF